MLTTLSAQAQAIPLALAVLNGVRLKRHIRLLEGRGRRGHRLDNLPSSRTRRTSQRRSQSSRARRSRSTPTPVPASHPEAHQDPDWPPSDGSVDTAVSYRAGTAPSRGASNASSRLHVVNSAPGDSTTSDDSDVEAQHPGVYRGQPQPSGSATHPTSDDDSFGLPRQSTFSRPVSTSSTAAAPYDPSLPHLDTHPAQLYPARPSTLSRNPEDPDGQSPRHYGHTYTSPAASPTSSNFSYTSNGLPASPPTTQVYKAYSRPDVSLATSAPLNDRDMLPSMLERCTSASSNRTYPRAGTITSPLVLPSAVSPTSSPTYATDWRPPHPSTSPVSSVRSAPTTSTTVGGFNPSRRKPLGPRAAPTSRRNPLPVGQRELPAFTGAASGSGQQRAMSGGSAGRGGGAASSSSPASPIAFDPDRLPEMPGEFYARTIA